MSAQIIKTDAAPPPSGTYSQGIKVGNFVFVAGQGPFHPKTEKLVGPDIESQTRQTLGNVKGVLEAAGFTMRDVVKVSVFLEKASDFERMNQVYQTFFPENPPSRTTLAAKLLDTGMLIEIDAVAFRQ